MTRSNLLTGKTAPKRETLVATDLPAYVPRDLDADLRTAATAAAAHGGLVLLVGGSSVGKTRAMFEVVRTVLPEWWLIHPTPPPCARSRPSRRRGPWCGWTNCSASSTPQLVCLSGSSAWGEAYEDNDLIWCREDGWPYPPDYVSRHFVELSEAAGLPRIQLHAGSAHGGDARPGGGYRHQGGGRADGPFGDWYHA